MYGRDVDPSTAMRRETSWPTGHSPYHALSSGEILGHRGDGHPEIQREPTMGGRPTAQGPSPLPAPQQQMTRTNLVSSAGQCCHDPSTSVTTRGGVPSMGYFSMRFPLLFG